MISVRLINNEEIVLNSDLIEFMEATPDTVISLSSGKKMIVRDSISDIVDKIVDFRRQLSVPEQLLTSHTSSTD